MASVDANALPDGVMTESVDLYDGDTFLSTVAVQNNTWSYTLTGVGKGQHSLKAVSRGVESNIRRFSLAPLEIVETEMVLDGLMIYRTGWTFSGVDAEKNTEVRNPTGGRAPYAYASLNHEVASVTTNGKVQGTGRGTTTIVVTDAQGTSVRYPVKVENIYQLHSSKDGFHGKQAIEWIIKQGGEQDYATIGKYVELLNKLYTRPFFTMPAWTGWLVPTPGRDDQYDCLHVDGTTGSYHVGTTHYAYTFIPK